MKSGVEPIQQLILRYEEHRAHTMNFNNSEVQKEGPVNVIRKNKDWASITGVSDPQFSGCTTNSSKAQQC